MTTAPLLDALDAATELRAARDAELVRYQQELCDALLAVQRVESLIAEITFERDELATAEDAAFAAFTAAGGRLDLSGYETRYAEYGD